MEIERKRKRLLIDVHPKFHADLKALAAKKQMSIKDMVIDALILLVNNQKV